MPADNRPAEEVAVTRISIPCASIAFIDEFDLHMRCETS